MPKKGQPPGPEHGNWKGGRYYTSDGYVLVRTDVGTYKREHRLVVEQQLGRPLRGDEIVHHINGVKDDNRPENLEVMTRADHVVHHDPRRIDRITKPCAACGTPITRRPGLFRRYPNPCCSRACVALISFGHLDRGRDDR